MFVAAVSLVWTATTIRQTAAKRVFVTALVGDSLSALHLLLLHSFLLLFSSNLPLAARPPPPPSCCFSSLKWLTLHQFHRGCGRIDSPPSQVELLQLQISFSLTSKSLLVKTWKQGLFCLGLKKLPFQYHLERKEHVHSCCRANWNGIDTYLLLFHWFPVWKLGSFSCKTKDAKMTVSQFPVNQANARMCKNFAKTLKLKQSVKMCYSFCIKKYFAQQICSIYNYFTHF